MTAYNFSYKSYINSATLFHTTNDREL